MWIELVDGVVPWSTSRETFQIMVRGSGLMKWVEVAGRGSGPRWRVEGVSRGSESRE